MENIWGVGQVLLVWGVVFAPILIILYAVIRSGTDATAEYKHRA